MDEQRPEEKPGAPERRGGVFVTKGMTLTIPTGGLTIRVTDEGKIEADPLVIHVSQDVSPFWIEVAIDHLISAESLHPEVLQANTSSDDERLARALEREFAASMQAVVSGAIAVDAFYAMVSRQVEVPENLRVQWRQDRTARYKQVAEVLRRAFKLEPNGVAWARTLLKDIYRFRDLAVHPVATPQKPVFYGEIGRGVEWRFDTFRFASAKLLVGASLALMCQLCERPDLASRQLAEYCSTARSRYDPSLANWLTRYGELYGQNQKGGEAEGINTH